MIKRLLAKNKTKQHNKKPTNKQTTNQQRRKRGFASFGSVLNSRLEKNKPRRLLSLPLSSSASHLGVTATFQCETAPACWVLWARGDQAITTAWLPVGRSRVTAPAQHAAGGTQHLPAGAAAPGGRVRTISRAAAELSPFQQVLELLRLPCSAGAQHRRPQVQHSPLPPSGVPCCQGWHQGALGEQSRAPAHGLVQKGHCGRMRRQQSGQITDKINFLKDKQLLGQKGNSPPYHEGKSIQTEEEAAKEPLSNITSTWAENDPVPSTHSLGNLHDERPHLPLHQLC